MIKRVMWLPLAMALCGCQAATVDKDAFMPADAAVADGPPERADAAPVCQKTCAACADNEACFVSDITAATCLRKCTTNTDCPPNQQCAELLIDTMDYPQKGPPYQFSPRLCYGWTYNLPAVCPGESQATHCDIGSTTNCDDGETLREPVTAPGTCGYDYLHCTNGCLSGIPDAGMFDYAQCK